MPKPRSSAGRGVMAERKQSGPPGASRIGSAATGSAPRLLGDQRYRGDALAHTPVSLHGWTAEIVALEVADPGFQQEICVLGVLDELGHGLKPEGGGEAHQVADEELVIDVA